MTTTTTADGGAPLMTLEEIGTRFEPDWRGYLVATSPTTTPPTTLPKRVSPWHDVEHIVSIDPLVLRVVVEIPKGTREKIEVDLKTPLNPLRQDVKKGKLRLFTYGDIPFDYGCLPRTYENPDAPDAVTGRLGDGDPLDVVVLGNGTAPHGTVMEVRVLGSLAMIDEGETDWKLLAVPYGTAAEKEAAATLAENASKLESLADPVRHWFRYYKTTDGKPENHFALSDMPVAETLKHTRQVVEDCSNTYERLLRGRLTGKKSEGLWVPPQ